MEVDHFDPRQRFDQPQSYANLLLSTRHCNLSKGSWFPGPDDEKDGIRIFNPCEEHDYDHELFEHPETHELVGTSPAAIHHIRLLDLNAPHLVEERQLRSEIREQIRVIESSKLDVPAIEWEDILRLLERVKAYQIPDIRFWDGSE